MEDSIKSNLVKDELTITLMKALLQNYVELVKIINNLEKKQVKDS
jgi:hypothetical protein